MTRIWVERCKARRCAGLRAGLRAERAFTVTELAVVVIIIGIILTTAIISYYTASRQTELVTATEQIKTALRQVYAMADSGQKTGANRHQYRITFNNNGLTPPNAYMIEVSTNGGGAWTPVTPDRKSSYKVVSTNWVQIGTASNIRLTYSNQIITFISRGSILETSPAGNKTVTVSTSGAGSFRTITVNDYGSVSP